MNRTILALIISILFIGTAEGFTPKKHTYLYAEKSGQKLYMDHYVANAEGERGCVVFMFGGAFAKGTRDNQAYATYFKELAEAGYDVISIDYRLGLKMLEKKEQEFTLSDMIGALYGSIDMAVEDLYSATLYILDNAKKWKIDTDKIVISGSSAGAISVLQAEYEICNRAENAAVLPEDFRYAGVISFAGALFSLNGEPQWAQKPAPIMLFHGNSDNQVPYKKATLLGTGFYGSQFIVNQLDKLSSPYWFYAVKYANHDLSVTPMRNNLVHIKEFLKDYVEQGSKKPRTTSVADTAYPKRQTSFSVDDYLKANYGL